MSRVYNFSAGPACLPECVLEEIRDEMLEYGDSGQSVMEMSHRSKVFEDILHDTENTLREIMGIPANYKVLFLQGGASQQFAAVPMNLMKNRVADYINTGNWTKKAIQEAKLFGKVNVIASSEDRTFTYIPDLEDLPYSEDADYVYICQNNTIYGTRYPKLPDTKGRILVSDVSSMFVSEPLDVSKYGVIYAGACMFPETTWIIKGMSHVEFGYDHETSDLALWLTTAKDPVDIHTDARYPQFTELDRSSGKLISLTQVNGQSAPEAEQPAPTFLQKIADFFNGLLEKVKSIFQR